MMSNEQHQKLILILDALRIAVLATIPASRMQERSEKAMMLASDKKAESALEPIIDMTPAHPVY
ncbi:hypothetical protein LCGC14_1781060 [marine sediment metagenome]|uniref:Uncharacterized protein n=1 Tax=marine sediment metagenome TaxID=412755 RepID=A0A0F9HI28_9ZZZZ